MKKQNRIVALILLCLIVATAFGVFAGCKDGEKNDGITIPTKRNFEGIHDFTATDTSVDLLVDGATDYVIVIPKESSPQILMAQSELITFFAEATGVRLSSITDEGLSHSASAKYISLGDTTLLASSGISYDKNVLTQDGTQVITKDNVIYIVGGSDYGVVNGVYDMLKIYFDLEFFYADTYTMTRNVKSLKLKNFKVTDIPDIKFRQNGYRSILSGENDYRFRYPVDAGNNRTFYINKDADDRYSPSKAVHNVTYWLPADDADADTNWYSTEGTEALCYTARGNEDSLDAMIDKVVYKAIKMLQYYPINEYPLLDIMTFTMEDTPKNCICDECRRQRDEYGSYSGALIKFMNRFRTELDATIEEMRQADPEGVSKWARDNLILTFFAYMQFEQAPTKKLDELHLVDGVSIYFAMNSSFDYQASVYDDVNKAPRENFDTWMSLGDQPLLWSYSTKFTSFLIPCDTFSFYNQDGYEYFASYNPKYMYNQTQGIQKGTMTAFHNLKLYLDSKLMWDTNLDAEKLTDDYMDAMFGPAAATMKELYNRERLQAGVVRGQYNSITILGNETDLQNPKFWPYPMVKEWLALCDKAFEQIEKYKEIDPELYTKYKQHIEAEWISPSFMALKFYSDYMEPAELKQLQSTFKEVVVRLGVSHTHEINGDIGAFIAGF